ncbi:MAG TPA: glycosyltransferase, partial [Methanothrix sp.]|nr:glycosyltransferase [Methanothrix sp.]
MLSWESLYSTKVGGVAPHVSEISEALARRGHEVHVFTRRGDFGSYDEINGVHYQRVDSDPSGDILAQMDRMSDAIFDRFPPDDLATARERAHQLLAQELASVAVEPSVRSLLGFLHRRGFRLGLLTNSGSPFREPFADAGLDTLFDAVLFSCDLGAKKPAAAAYQAILERLGVAPEE